MTSSARAGTPERASARRALALPVVVLAAGLAAACGSSTVRPEGAARSVADVVSEKTGFRPGDVTCPRGVRAEVGGTFECRFTGPDGPYVAHMRILEVKGERVVFDVRTRRAK